MVKQIGKGVIYDPGVYIGIVQSITEREGIYGPYYIWAFLIKSAKRNGKRLSGLRKVTGISGGTFSPGSKLYRWAKAVGLDVDEDAVRAMEY